MKVLRVVLCVGAMLTFLVSGLAVLAGQRRI
jgi:hypothetical protein